MTGFLLSQERRQDWIPACEDYAKIQYSSFLTPLAPLIRGELSRESPPDKGDLGGWVFRQHDLARVSYTKRPKDLTLCAFHGEFEVIQ